MEGLQLKVLILRAVHRNVLRVDSDVVQIRKHQLEGQMKKDAHQIVQEQDLDVVLIIELLPEDLMVRDALFTVPDIGTVVVQTM